MHELYCEAHSDIDGGPESNDGKAENGVYNLSSGNQIDAQISSASEGSTMKLEALNREQFGESRNRAAPGRNVVERNCSAEDGVSIISAEVSDHAKTSGQDHELTQSACNLTSSSKSSIKDRTRIDFLDNLYGDPESQDAPKLIDSVETNEAAVCPWWCCLGYLPLATCS